MNLAVILQILGALGVVIPPPWGPIIKGITLVLPILEKGIPLLEAIPQADPNLMTHIETAAGQMGIDTSQLAMIAFAPHRMSFEEEQAWMNRASGGPRT